MHAQRYKVLRIELLRVYLEVHPPTMDIKVARTILLDAYDSMRGKGVYILDEKKLHPQVVASVGV